MRLIIYISVSLSVFAVICLLSTKICYINPDETYSWFSGIWHGIFILPHWVVSWFTDGVYCKAPNASTAYSIWWWIFLVSTVFAILSPAKNR